MPGRTQPRDPRDAAETDGLATVMKASTHSPRETRDAGIDYKSRERMSSAVAALTPFCHF